MILNRQNREAILRQRYAALTKEQRESAEGKDLKMQIDYFNKTKSTGAGNAPIFG